MVYLNELNGSLILIYGKDCLICLKWEQMFFYYFVHYSSTSEEINKFVAKNTIIAVVKLLKLITDQYLFKYEKDDFLFCGIFQAIRTIQKAYNWSSASFVVT